LVIFLKVRYLRPKKGRGATLRASPSMLTARYGEWEGHAWQPRMLLSFPGALAQVLATPGRPLQARCSLRARAICHCASCILCVAVCSTYLSQFHACGNCNPIWPDACSDWFKGEQVTYRASQAKSFLGDSAQAVPPTVPRAAQIYPVQRPRSHWPPQGLHGQRQVQGDTQQ
jgi:hypothetical protein